MTVKASLLEEAVQTSYEKAGQMACPEECVTKETVMRQARKMDIPEKSQESHVEKKKAKYLYVEADEDHIALQFHFKFETKGIAQRRRR